MDDPTPHGIVNTVVAGGSLRVLDRPGKGTSSDVLDSLISTLVEDLPTLGGGSQGLAGYSSIHRIVHLLYYGLWIV